MKPTNLCRKDRAKRKRQNGITAFEAQVDALPMIAMKVFVCCSLALLFCCCLLSSIYFDLYNDLSARKPITVDQPWISFTNQFPRLKLKYNEVTPKIGWKVISVAVENVLTRRKNVGDDNDHVPAVLLVVGSQANANVVECFVSDLNDVIAKAYHIPTGNVFQAKLLNTLKANDICEFFENNFVKDEKRVIVINGIESIYLPMTLHRYVDHSHAVYRDVVILLTAYRNQQILLDLDRVNSRTMDSIATELLERSWISLLDEANIAALLSRLTPSVVVLSDKGNKSPTC